MVGGSPTGLVGAAVVAVQLPTSGAVPVRIRKSSRTVAVESSGPTLLEWVASPLTCCDGSGASGCGAFLTGGTVGRCWLRSGFGLGVAVLVDRWARRDSWGGVWQRAADTRAHSLLLGSGLPGGWIGLHRRSLAAIPAGVSKVYALGAKTALIPQRREGEERKKERLRHSPVPSIPYIHVPASTNPTPNSTYPALDRPTAQRAHITASHSAQPHHHHPNSKPPSDAPWPNPNPGSAASPGRPQPGRIGRPAAGLTKLQATASPNVHNRSPGDLQLWEMQHQGQL